MPWWWTFIIQIERRLDSLREAAAYDPDKLAPPKDIWPLSMSEQLDAWFLERQELSERRSREKQPLQNW